MARGPVLWLPSRHLLTSDLLSEAAACRTGTDGFGFAGSKEDGHLSELQGVPHNSCWEKCFPYPADTL